MKKALIILSIFAATPAFACNQLEAQLIAKAASIEPANNGQCRVKLSWTGNWQLNPSFQCPLDIDEVSSFGVITSCNVKEGDTVTGIVYRDINVSPTEIYLY
ncbi:hypothetical protein AZI85_04015 [Bdellovibrio bacteriovorus]|uniref:Secreted protein n=1 Tax=Bdellovibrio bacteriovorus TaxID=959 RepID=A0A150WKX6_BDEBC|nr:hypothetical protein [Bdellovibrio bacteriovorus]KYG64584.1 hypothetical protein AZI85_04015 [Bdellovibrio bacteriovorus]